MNELETEHSEASQKEVDRAYNSRLETAKNATGSLLEHLGYGSEDERVEDPASADQEELDQIYEDIDGRTTFEYREQE